MAKRVLIAHQIASHDLDLLAEIVEVIIDDCLDLPFGPDSFSGRAVAVDQRVAEDTRPKRVHDGGDMVASTEVISLARLGRDVTDVDDRAPRPADRFDHAV